MKIIKLKFKHHFIGFTYCDYQYLICFSLLFLLPQLNFAQKADQNTEVNIKNPKADKVINKVIYAFSFLNYTDRKRDRVLDGPEDFERFRGKKIQQIKYTNLKPYGVSIKHPDTPVTKKLSRFANRIHISTKPWVIKTEMLIKRRRHHRFAASGRYAAKYLE